MPEPEDPDRASYQSLYRRFRPQRFDEVLGQQHVSLALRNAVRDGRVGHAYLFSGPRGTGKTSTARILAKALNCADPHDGEPCGICGSCVEIARGTSMDVHELDAASNNGVDSMRDLVAHSALGTPGRWKVYIVDEVHMLSTAASNALLKTLEEPPRHVVFVLATTDAQKVLPTIRSRTQHFEFRLLGPEVLSGLLKQVRSDAGLEVEDDALDAAVRRGRGSARDALSALDQVAAGGTVRDEVAALAEMAEGMAEGDPAAVLVELARAFQAGLDSQRLAAELADYLRQGFLAVLAPELVSLTGEDRVRVEDLSRRMGLPALVRSMEALGRALVDMRESPDPRVHLEATLIRLAHPELDDSAAALLERVERLERALAAGDHSAPATASRKLEGVPAPAAHPSPSSRGEAEPEGASPGRAARSAPARRKGGDDAEAEGAGRPSEQAYAASGPALARRALGELRDDKPRARSGAGREAGESEDSRSSLLMAPATEAQSSSDPEKSNALPSRDELVQVWGDELLAKLPSRARVRYRVGRFVSSEHGSVVFALPNETHRSYCAEVQSDVEAALRERFGAPVPLTLVVDDDLSEESSASVPDGFLRAPRGRAPGRTDVVEEPDLLDPAVLEEETEPAGAGPSPEDRIKLAFPGAVEV